MSSSRNFKGVKLKIETEYEVPSWNKLLAMNPFDRMRARKKCQEKLLSTLRAAAKDSSIQTTSQSSLFSIASDTLELFLATGPKTSSYKSSKSKCMEMIQAAQSSKSSIPMVK